MKYILLFCGTRDDPRPKRSPEEVRQVYADNDDWFRLNAAKVVSSYQLRPPDTATTLLAHPIPILKDGPFLEGKELIGGFCVIDVADLDEALGMARTWPGQSWAVEIRPVVE
jgi:hypothetical protein